MVDDLKCLLTHEERAVILRNYGETPPIDPGMLPGKVIPSQNPSNKALEMWTVPGKEPYLRSQGSWSKLMDMRCRGGHCIQARPSWVLKRFHRYNRRKHYWRLVCPLCQVVDYARLVNHTCEHRGWVMLQELLDPMVALSMSQPCRLCTEEENQHWEGHPIRATYSTRAWDGAHYTLNDSLSGGRTLCLVSSQDRVFLVSQKGESAYLGTIPGLHQSRSRDNLLELIQSNGSGVTEPHPWGSAHPLIIPESWDDERGGVFLHGGSYFMADTYRATVWFHGVELGKFTPVVCYTSGMEGATIRVSPEARRFGVSIVGTVKSGKFHRNAGAGVVIEVQGDPL